MVTSDARSTLCALTIVPLMTVSERERLIDLQVAVLDRDDTLSLEDRVRLLMSLTQNAYMRNSYGEQSWRAMCRYLVRNGWSILEVERVLMSKIPRWADDFCGRGIGKRTSSRAFNEYIGNLSYKDVASSIEGGWA